jgi:hypothetical protein
MRALNRIDFAIAAAVCLISGCQNRGSRFTGAELLTARCFYYAQLDALSAALKAPTDNQFDALDDQRRHLDERHLQQLVAQFAISSTDAVALMDAARRQVLSPQGPHYSDTR